MNRLSFRLISAVLLIAMLVGILPAAFADGAAAGSGTGNYTPAQYYVYDEYGTKVYTVQFSAGEVLQGAEKNRDAMLAAGYDAFVYKQGAVYYIMSGKFRSYADANSYRSKVEKVKGAEDGFITFAMLPEWAVTDFESAYYGMPAIFLNDAASFGAGKGDYRQSNGNPLLSGAYRDWSDYGWSISIPSSFSVYDESSEHRLYYHYDYDMAVEISWEPVAAQSAKSREAILSSDYESELKKHQRVTYDALHDDYFTATGFDGDYVFYIRGILKGSTYYRMSFCYPAANKGWCDPLLESIRDSFRG